MSRGRLGILLLGLLAFPIVADGEPIPVLLSKGHSLYQRIVDLFEETVGEDVRTYDMDGDTALGKSIAEEISVLKPRVVLAIGSSAARVAEEEIDIEIPVVFCMVADPAAAGLEGARHSTGVTLSIPLNLQFGAMKAVLPDAEVVATIYDSSATRHVIDEAYMAAAIQGFRLLPKPVSREDDVLEVFMSTSGSSDALWIFPDPTVLRKAELLVMLAKERHLPVFAPSSKMVKMGALMALVPDYLDSGRQAADLARRVLAGERAQDLPFAAPASLKLLINQETANDLDIKKTPVLHGIPVEYE